MRKIYSIKTSRVSRGSVVERYTTGVCCWASSIVGTAQCFKVSKNMETAVEDTVRGFLRGAVIWVFNHVPVAKGNAA